MDSIADIFGKALALALSLVVLAACPARADLQDGAAVTAAAEPL